MFIIKVKSNGRHIIRRQRSALFAALITRDGNRTRRPLVRRYEYKGIIMKKTFAILSLLFMASCVSPPQREVPAIIADGTELSQFENLFFCGDSENFAKVMGQVGKELGDAWEQVQGESSTDKCTIRIKTDNSGVIVSHEIVECDKPQVINKVLVLASPVTLPNDQCLINKVNGIKFVLNSGNEKDS